ncbi:hypothetical protein TNCV_1992141 [Trichonephila clavipes]|nr:hypothetical protein TNCV_1992141 [Trichonephila clavipes]
MSFGFFGPELMATLFQPNPRSEVWMKDANEQAFKYLNLECINRCDGHEVLAGIFDSWLRVLGATVAPPFKGAGAR